MGQASGLQRTGLWTGLVMLTNPGTPHSPTDGWPVIQPLHAEYVFVAPKYPGLDTPFVLYLKDQDDTQRYKFECHDGEYTDDSVMKFSGDFQCALFGFKGMTVSAVNLLAADTREEQRDDGWNRGRVRAQQLRGSCLDYPEYSTLRHFRLEGMALTLSITHVEWNPAQGSKSPTLAGFTFDVDAVPDKDAKSPMAERAEGPRPPRACYP
ncbi:MAG: hypothetical protein ACHQAZ_05065 [Gammaproteobacteria bacterium]